MEAPTLIIGSGSRFQGGRKSPPARQAAPTVTLYIAFSGDQQSKVVVKDVPMNLIRRFTEIGRDPVFANKRTVGPLFCLVHSSTS